MEIFDDHWGPVGSIERSISNSTLQSFWVSLVAIPLVTVFLAHSGYLSKIGTDIQLISGKHAIAREWSLRFAQHPALIGGIEYPSRHDTDRLNIALYSKPNLFPPTLNTKLIYKAIVYPKNMTKRHILYGPPVLLADHPELESSLKILQVARLP
jgi:hypothetical protein